MRVRSNRTIGALLVCAGLAAAAASATAGGKKVAGWTDWRGPLQTGVSLEKSLPTTVSQTGGNLLWTMDVSGRGTPVVANGRIYALGYSGTDAALQELIVCADAETGKKIWEHRFNDFLSDVIYDRYAIGGPTVDPQTGNIYVMTTAGLFSAFNPAGKQLWQHSMMEQFGRLTFPNGRMGWPLIEEEMVIIRGITGNWGATGAAGDRLYAFDKLTGNLIWTSSPGLQPKDNNFASPHVVTRGGKRIGYTTVGDGGVAAINMRTGEVLWRFPFSAGSGPNVSPVLYKNLLIVAQDAENVDTSDSGRMAAFNVDGTVTPVPAMPGVAAQPPLLDKSAEAWRLPLASFSSSPVLVGDRVYLVDKTGILHCVDAGAGKILWSKKLGPDQIHASPLYGDGKLYVPLNDGTFHILKPSDTGAEELSKIKLAGNCLGAPAVWNGKIYVHTNEKLYCWGKKGAGASTPEPAATPRPKAGAPVALQVIPSEVLLLPSQKAAFTIRGIDANGYPTGNYPLNKAKWAKFIPPTALVRAEMNASVNEKGEMTAGSEPMPSAGAWEVTVDGLKGYTRGRILPGLPLKQDFEKIELNTDHATETGVKFSHPPLPWIGARLRWEVRDLEGNKVLRKTLDNVFFQRATTFVGTPAMKNYTVEADVMSDGNRRQMGMVGLLNQRYLIVFQGNAGQLEINSNLERIRKNVAFPIQPKVWYRLKTRVDVAADGSGVVRAKAWKKGDPEPAAWTLELQHAQAHTSGSPGVYGFAPQSKFAVYVDNLSVTPNAPLITRRVPGGFSANL